MLLRASLKRSLHDHEGALSRGVTQLATRAASSVLTSPHVQPLSPGDPEGADDTGVVSRPVLRDQDSRALSQHGAGHLSGPRGSGDPHAGWRDGDGGDAVGLSAAT